MRLSNFFTSLTLVGISTLFTLALRGNPTGATVTAGHASISSSSKTLNVTQVSSKAIIDWKTFSIGQGETTRFIQPNHNAAVLNRVTGANASSLLGTLQANGQVYLINQNGILFGKGSLINVGGFAASTLNVSDAQFLKGGDLTFSGASKAGISNAGTIRATDGDVILMASQVENTGQLQAGKGIVALGAGQKIRLIQKGDQRLSVLPAGGTGQALNQGQIDAVQAELKADGGNLYSLAVNNSGVINATGIVQKNGHVFLSAVSGSTQNSGQITARNADGSGGQIEILGGKVHLTSSSKIDASGVGGGGTVLVGGDLHGANPDVQNAETTKVDAGSEIKADALNTGKGGQVIVWSQQATDFAGHISAQGGALSGDGGMAEISSHQLLTFNGVTELNGPHGANGDLLLDPSTITIKEGTGTGTTVNGASVIYQSQLEAMTSNISLEATSAITAAANNPSSPFFVLLKKNVSFDAFLDGSGTIDLSQADFISSLSQTSSAEFHIGQPGDNATVDILVHDLVSGTGGVNIYGRNRSISGSISGQFVTIRPGGTINLKPGASISTFGGDIDFLAPVIIASNQAITIQNDQDANLGSNVHFASTINGFGSLNIQSSGPVGLDGAIGGTTALISLEIHTPSSVTLPAVNAGSVSIGAETTGMHVAPLSIAQTGPIVATTFSATTRGDITLNDAGNQITNLDTTTFKNNFQLTNSIDLNVVGAIKGDATSSQITINDQGGAITLAAAHDLFDGASLTISGTQGVGSPNNLILSSDVGVFNNVGASVLTTNTGSRWIIYAPSSDPSVLKLNGLVADQTTTGAYPTIPSGAGNLLVLQNGGSGMPIQIIDIVAGNNAPDDALLDDGKILFSDTTTTGTATISQGKLDSLTGNIVLQAQQLIDLGLGADLDLTGVLTANSILFQTRLAAGDKLTFGANVSTAGGAINLLSPALVLTHDVSLNTGTHDSITFQGTVESKAGLDPSLIVTSGTVTFDKSVGALHPLSRLSVVAANNIQISGNITTFGNQEYLAFGTNFFNGDLDASGAIDISGPTVIEKNGIVVHSRGTEIIDGVFVEDPITTQGNAPKDITIESDSISPSQSNDEGGIQFKTINAGGGNIALRADTIIFNSIQSNGGKLTLQPRDANGTIALGDSSGPLPGELLLPQSQIDRINPDLAELDLDAGFGRIRVGDITLPFSTVISANNINVSGTITQSVGSQTVTLDGPTEFDGGSVNLAGAVTFLGAVTLNAASTTIAANGIHLPGQSIDSIGLTAANSKLVLVSFTGNIDAGPIGINGKVSSLTVYGPQVNLVDLNVGALNVSDAVNFVDTHVVTADQVTFNTPAGTSLLNTANRIGTLNESTIGGAGLFLATNGDLKVGGAVTAQANAPVNLAALNGSLFLLSGSQIVSSGSAGDMSLYGSQGFFNLEGAAALSVSNGARWLIYAPGTNSGVLALNGLVPGFQVDLPYPTVPANTPATPSTANGLIAPNPPTPPPSPNDRTLQGLQTAGLQLNNPYIFFKIPPQITVAPTNPLNAYEQNLQDIGDQVLASNDGAAVQALLDPSRSFVSTAGAGMLLSLAKANEASGTPWQILTMPQVQGALKAVPDHTMLAFSSVHGTGTVSIVTFDAATRQSTTIQLPPGWGVAKITDSDGTPELVTTDPAGLADKVITNGAIISQGTGNYVSSYVSPVATGNQVVAKAEQAVGGPLVTLSNGQCVFVPGTTTATNNMGGLGKPVTSAMIDAIVAQGGGNLKRSDVVNIVAQGGGNFTAGVAAAIIAAGSPGIVAQGGGNIVAQGGGNIVAQGGGNLTATQIMNIVAQGGGNIVAQGGGNIVAQGGGNVVDPLAMMNIVSASIVAQGGGNIVAQGGGNIVAQGGGNIVAQGGGNIVAQGGGNIVAQGGGNIVAQGGGNLSSLIANIVAAGGGNIAATDVTRIVAQGGGNIVAQGGGNIVAQGGGNIVAQGGGNIVAQGGGNLVGNPIMMSIAASIVAQGGGNIVAQGGGNIVAQGGGNIVAQGGGNFQKAITVLANAGELDQATLTKIGISSSTSTETITSADVLFASVQKVINTNGSNLNINTISSVGSTAMNLNSKVISTNGSN